MKHRPRSKIPMFVACVVVAAVILAMSGACSQHEPGPWEGGGRTFEVPTAQGTSITDSGGDRLIIPDSFVPDAKGN